MTTKADPPMRVALAGFGTVGQALARRLCDGAIDAVRLTAVSARDLARAEANCAGLEPRPLVVPVAALVEHAEVIVECATAEALVEIARAALGAGRTLVPVSVGGIAAHPEILEWPRELGGRIRVATGALPGLDAIRTAAEGGIESVSLTSRIRPESLAREPYVLERGLDFSKPMSEAVQVFEGSAQRAAIAFPKHFNVAVTLSLAGIGLERTRVVLVAEPNVAGTVHSVEVVGRDIQLSLESRNLPSATNPRTSRAVAASLLAALRTLVTPIQVGS